MEVALSEAPATALCQYQETRIDLEPFYPNSTIHIQLPSTTNLIRNAGTRIRLSSVAHCRDEESFKKKYIANFGSTYFGKSKKYPRNFIWRCLEERTVLELRSADLDKEEHEIKEASLILQFGFPGPIHNHGVALASTTEQDILSVFVLTKSNDLYTFTLRPDAFCQRPSEDDIGRWYKIFKPASFTISSAFRVFACSTHELIITLDDGRLMRLRRNSGDDGSTWQERTFGDGHWASSLRGIVRWQGSHTVPHDGNVLDQNTAIEVAPSPDGNHILAVCLNHTLKAWNHETGKVTFSKDLLDERREPQDIPRVMLNPITTGILQVFEAHGAKEGDQYYIATYSPHGTGIFKFWGIRDADHAFAGVRDLFPDQTFRSPDPQDSALWTIANFKIRGAPRGLGIEIWILMRLNRRYKLYSRRFDLHDLANNWHHGWSITAVDIEKRKPYNQPPSATSDLDPQDVSERWLEYVLAPGRIPQPTLETALSIYCKATKIDYPEPSKGSLKSRLASCMGSRIQLDQKQAEKQRYKAYRKEIESQWITLWSIASDMDQSRWDPLSLGLDETANVPWILFTDGCSIIRTCSPIEVLIQNSSEDLRQNMDLIELQSVEMADYDPEPSLPNELAILINASAQFRATLSTSLTLACNNLLESELWQGPSYSVPVRVQYFYDQCNFAEEVDDRQYSELVANLADVGGFKDLSTAHFKAILKRLPQGMATDSFGLRSTGFGLKALVNGAQDIIAQNTRILTDLLLLAVFVDGEVDREEIAMNHFVITSIYPQLLYQLKLYRIMSWLITNVRQEPAASEENHPKITFLGTSTNPQVRFSTVLENLFAIDIRPRAYSDEPQSDTFTQTVEDLLAWVAGGNSAVAIPIDDIIVHIQCNLLKNSNLNLASSFLQYQPTTDWSTYIRGRLHLLRHEYSEAALAFKSAAFNLSRPSKKDYVEESSNFLSSLTASFLSSGPCNYYCHVVSLFENPSSPATTAPYVLSFARLALQHSSHTASVDQHSDILTRLFYAAMTIFDFSTAFSAVSRFTDKALQKNFLARLIESMLEEGEVNAMVKLPWLALSDNVDAFLAQKTHQYLHHYHQSSSTLLHPSSASPSVSIAGMQWHKILYSYRISRGDFRGAASVLINQLEAHKAAIAFKTKKAPPPGMRVGSSSANKEEQGLLNEYLVLINALAVLNAEGEGWVFVEGSEEAANGDETKKRRVVRLEDLRAMYQEELDRRCAGEIVDHFEGFGVAEEAGDVDMEG
ncbi:MAG: hypothetical protein MMC33_006604 [Icmadophila ericetorum]|nr:hypothetical protein [Icmadophila ericetorum]